MNPAYSVILFTTASGAGYGLLTVLGFAASSHGRASSTAFALTSLGLALVMITVGLLSSTLHLGRPERAWRAFSQWRTSWLSREGILAIITYPVALAFGLCWSALIDAPGLIAPLGIASAILSMATIFCTAKIYSSLKTIPAWHSAWTVPGYIAFGLATGAVWLTAIAEAFGRFVYFQSLLAAVAIVATLIIKYFYWLRQDMRAKSLTMANATGLGQGVRQWEVPHTSRNFIMKEMGYSVARNHARKLRLWCMVLLNIAALLMLACIAFPYVSYIAVPVIMLAAWIERWLFFATAEHVSSLYYGVPAV